MRSIYLFIIIMWGMMLGGGGIAVKILGPLSADEYGLEPIILSVIKAAIAILLVILWVVALIWIKCLIFRRVRG